MHGKWQLHQALSPETGRKCVFDLIVEARYRLMCIAFRSPTAVTATGADLPLATRRSSTDITLTSQTSIFLALGISNGDSHGS
jgi:hypothetical protein